jgi:hypothetical protein
MVLELEFMSGFVSFIAELFNESVDQLENQTDA